MRRHLAINLPARLLVCVLLTFMGGTPSNTWVNPFQATFAGVTRSLVVNTADDTINGTCDAAHCSLREAINAANASRGQDTIYFSIPGSGPHTILVLRGGLPIITDAVMIDGTTQPGFTLHPRIVLDGTQAGAANGLWITGGGSTVQGLALNNFVGAGILLTIGGNNTLQRNFIGVDAATGTQARGNRDGVYLLASGNNLIGGADDSVGNVISGNTDDGVNLEGPLSTGNRIQGNFIGTQVDGVLPLGNSGDGIKISGTSSDNTVGGNTPDALNIIAFNGRNGVYIEEGDRATGNAILGNSIFSNTRLGIDLLDDLVTPNDSDDADTGPNNLQNYPVFQSAIADETTITITGILNSTPDTIFRIEFFQNTTCATGGNSDGAALLDTMQVTTDGSGLAPITLVIPAPILSGQRITAMATDPDNNTSEFSPCVAVSDSPNL
jgi:CSLREA domain-containing protein